MVWFFGQAETVVICGTGITCHPDKAAELCPQGISRFLPLKTIAELLCTAELAPTLSSSLTYFPEPAVPGFAGAWHHWGCPGGNTQGSGQALGSPFALAQVPQHQWGTWRSQQQAKQRIKLSARNSMASCGSWKQRIWAPSSSPDEFFLVPKCLDLSPTPNPSFDRFVWLNFSAPNVNTLPRRRQVLHRTSQWQGRVNMVASCPGEAFLTYLSINLASLISQGFVTVPLVNLRLAYHR